MVRFALDPAGQVIPDFAGKLPGRGAWVTADKNALSRAISKKLFARAFKAQAAANDDLIEVVASGLERRALDAIGLARRAGQAVAGFDQVKSALAGDAVAVVTARDAAEDGARKLRQAAKNAAAFRLFTTADLSAALGKDGVRHVALRRGPAAERFLTEARRLAGFVDEAEIVRQPGGESRN
jgi:predicted RNA-binding protein YlxR (DUF448 family)